ncbi:TMEM165/GDT1 family protein [Oligella urethralis]
MDAFIASFLAVALAEVGDKTQLLALFLTAVFARKFAIVCGIFIATV